jgi:hypothetical protein
MTKKANAYLSTSVVRQENFLETPDLTQVFSKHVISQQFPKDRFEIHCSYKGEFHGTGMVLHFTSQISNLDKPAAIKHKFFFPKGEQQEQREQAFIVTPENPIADSKVPIFIQDHRNDYCHVAVYDSDNYLLASYTLVFNRNGKLFPFSFTQKYVSPLPLKDAQIFETRNTEGKRVLRFYVSLKELDEPQIVRMAWETNGIELKHEFQYTPQQLEFFSDMELEGNSSLVPGDWVLIAVDAQECVLAQALVTVQPVFEESSQQLLDSVNNLTLVSAQARA